MPVTRNSNGPDGDWGLELDRAAHVMDRAAIVNEQPADPLDELAADAAAVRDLEVRMRQLPLRLRPRLANAHLFLVRAAVALEWELSVAEQEERA